MSLTDELRKLQQLHESGGLTAEEYAQAKAAILKNPPVAPAPPPPPVYYPPTQNDSLGDAAQTWVTFQIVSGVIGAIIAAIVFFSFILPKINSIPGR